VGAKRVIWHVGFERNLRRRGPRSFEVRAEVPLSEEPARLDYLLLRKLAPEGETLPDDSAETLRRLWALLPRVSVVEYKSPGHPYRPGHLDRLWSYVHAYFANQRTRPRKRADGTPLAPGMDDAPEVWTREELCAVLVVPERTPSLLADVESMRLGWEDLGDGYWRVTGGAFALYVVEIDVVGPAEGDDLLHSLGHGKPLTREARWFWMELVGTKESGMSMQDMEGYDELMQRLLDALPPEQVQKLLNSLPPEQRLAGLPPEQRLAGLPPEQRLAGLLPEQRLADLDRDHQALALPVELLRLLPDAYLRSLSPEVEAELRRRLQQNEH
jgi:hypothetical protein